MLFWTLPRALFRAFFGAHLGLSPVATLEAFLGAHFGIGFLEYRLQMARLPLL